MKHRIPVVVAVVSLLTVNACASQRTIATERIQSGHLEEVLPPSTRVRLELRSGDEIRARVQSMSDSSLTLRFEHHQFIGHADSIVVPVDDIETVKVVAENPLRHVTAFFVVTVSVLAIALIIAWHGAPLGGG